MRSSTKSNAFRLKLAYVCSIVPVAAALVGLRLYVTSSGKLSVFFAIITALFCACCGLYAFFLRKEVADGLKQGTPAVTFGSAAAGLLCATVLIASFFMEHEPDENIVISIFMKVFSGFAAVYFLGSAASSRLNGKAGISAALSMAVPLYLAFRTLNDFINVGGMPYAHSGAYHLLSLMCATLFFITETRQIIGAGRPFWMLFTGGASILLLCIYDLPVCIHFIQGLEVTGYEVLQSVLNFSIALYILIRIASCPLKKPAPNGSENGQPEQAGSDEPEKKETGSVSE